MAIALGTSATQLKVGAGTVSRVYKGSTAFWDSDAAAYTAAVEAADGQSLELGVVAAYHNFILGCKADGIWDAIKASSILCGARTLAGALVPLVGTAPTNVADGFVGGDYTRGGATPGLQSDGTSYLDSGRANNADPQDDNHNAVYATAANTIAGGGLFIGDSAGGSVGQNSIGSQPGFSRAFTRNRSSAPSLFAGQHSATGLVAVSRSSGIGYTARFSGSNTELAVASDGLTTSNVTIFNNTNARLAFYSIGESLDLALLDARVTALVTAIGAAV